MKFKESDPSSEIEIGTIFIKLNWYTCFDVSNQRSGMHLGRRRQQHQLWWLAGRGVREKRGAKEPRQLIPYKK